MKTNLLQRKRLLTEESNRCYLCDAPVCTKACKPGLDPGRLLRACKMDNLAGAILRAYRMEACKDCDGHPCEKACLRGRTDRALEAACWIAIGKADRVILAGDHHQLPPTIKCIEAARGGLDHTLMQKITDQKPETVSLLKTQYRMNESIMRFPSRWFYRDELQSAPEVKHRGILEFDTPVVWLDTADCHFEEDQLTDSMSRINKDEATLLVSTLQKYIEKIGKERVLDESIDFGLISPYKSQVQYIRGLVKRNVFFKPFRRLITVHTVDGFQGQERDVIMISLVRANDKGRIGFLGDLRRMNVAITRARMKLMILGDAPTLTRHAFYKELYEYIRENGQVVSTFNSP